MCTLPGITHGFFEHNVLSYDLGGSIVVLRKKDGDPTAVRNLSNAQQPVEVSGIVTDSLGNPLEGVSVLVRESGRGTATDVNGQFSIRVARSRTLVFRMMGYQERSVPVIGEQTSIRVVLAPALSGLDEVVVVGYGEQRRSDITGSVASIKSEDLEKAVFNTIDQTLQGRVAGVQVTQASAEPGGAVSVRIRGSNSISGNNEPLYVVDGFPLPEGDEAPGADRSTPGNALAGLNPDDIETIDILKDASATAIYGSRGANGVVIITTKKGTAQTASVELSSRTGISSIRNKFDMMDGASYAAYRNELFLAQNPGSENLPYDLSSLPDNDITWLDVISRHAVRQEYNIRVRSGQGGSNYMVSGNYLADDAVLVASGLKRGSLRGNFATQVNQRIRLGLNLNASRTMNSRAINDARGFPNSASPILYAMRASPLMRLNQAVDPSQMLEDEDGNVFFNPFIELTEKIDNTNNNMLLGNLDLKIDIGNGFSLATNAGAHHNNSKREIFLGKNVARGMTMGGEASVAERNNYSYVISNVLNYNRNVQAHRINAMLGTEYTNFSSSTLNVRVNEFEMDALGADNLNFGINRSVTSSGRIKYLLQSYFARVNYNYDGRYLATFTGRADGSSKFAENNKWAYFPSGAIAWHISNEDFMDDIKAVDDLKLRASYGATGSQAISPYQSLATYNVNYYPVDNQNKAVIAPISVANPDLRWETTQQFDAGLDLALFSGRLAMVADYYHKRTRDLLQRINLPTQSGLNTAVVNMGSIENRGWEFQLSGQIIDRPAFKWNSSVNYTWFTTKVLDLGNNPEIFGPAIGTNNYVGSAGHIYRPGQEYGLFYGYKVVGLIQHDDFDEDGNPLFALLNGDRRLGHWKYEDMNDDGVIDLADRQVIGSSNPDYVFGWTNDFTYKNLSLNIFIRGQVGNQVMNVLDTWFNSGIAGGWNQMQGWWDKRWTEENQHTNVRYPSGNNTPGDPHSVMLQDGSFLRLQSVSLRYRIPVKASFVSQIQLDVTGTNLYTITNYTGFDPEVSIHGHNTLAPGVDMGAYPRPRNFTFAISATF